VDEHDGMNPAEDLAERARELSARAERIAQHAAGAAESAEALAELERELADLDEEERKLDDEFQQLGAEPAGDETGGERTERPHSGDWTTGWADRFAERMESLGNRISEAITGALSSRPFGISDTIERDVAVDGPLPVTIESFAGKVTVRAGSSERVSAVAERHGWNEVDRDDITLDVTRDEQGVHVRCRTTRSFGHKWVNLDVAVPSSSATTVDTQGGAIRVEDVGGPVVANTRGGSIRVDGGVGAARLETRGGTIAVSDHDGPVTARTKGGSVKLSGKLSDEVDVETMGGAIQLDRVDGCVQARTMGGSIHVRGRLRGDCRVTTVGGSVSVEIPNGNQLRVEGSGNSATVDAPGLHAANGRIEGTIGDGSDGTLHLSTSGGAVRVHLI
jgi:Toastrack DUF4097